MNVSLKLGSGEITKVTTTSHFNWPNTNEDHDIWRWKSTCL